MTRKDRLRYWAIRRLLTTDESKYITYGLNKSKKSLMGKALDDISGNYETLKNESNFCNVLMRNLEKQKTESLKDIFLNK